MRPSKAHYVTSCQQLLALGAVLAVLTPAASVVSLDVRHEAPGRAVGGGLTVTPGERPAPSRPADRPTRAGSPEADHDVAQDDAGSRVPTEAVKAQVAEVSLTPDTDADTDSAVPADPAPQARERDRDPQEQTVDTTVVSAPQPVTGYGAVGVTWSHEEQVADDEIRLQVRSETAGRWSEWTALEYHDEHAPDPASTEGQDSRPGTDPLLVGEVDRVQARAVADQGLPADMSLAVVTPGKAPAAATQAPELGLPATTASQDADRVDGSDEEAIELQASSSSAPQPTIYSRKQWGADERLRSGRPSYGTISAGFVHHTVNGNTYTRAQVPGIIRSIYAYHTRSRGWSDVGYNFLVDKFGRIWEGRAGGIKRPVIGAHTLGYNGDSFAMSAIGNFDTVRPPDAMLRAYGSLFAWKLGLHGVDPMDSSQSVNGTRFKAINGHRDAGSTACPGRYLYARLPAIRRYADAAATKTPSPPPAPAPVVAKQVDSDLAGTSYPDLVVRRASDGRGMILPTGGLTAFRKPSVVSRSGWGRREFQVTPDLTGDDRVDLVTFDKGGSLQIRAGRAGGTFGPVSRTARRFRNHQLVTAVGDLNGDDRTDFVARKSGTLVTWQRTRRGGFRRVGRETSLRGYGQLVAAGDVTGDGRPDLWGRNQQGRLFLHRGERGARFADRTAVAGDWSGFDWFAGGVDYTGDAVPDLIARRTNGALMLVPAQGDGGLGRPVGPVQGPAGLRMLGGAGQISGTSAPDLLAARSDGALVVLRNRGTFDLGRAIDTGQSFSNANLLINAGDFTDNGRGDVIVRRRSGSLWLHRGNGKGKLSDPVRIGGRRAFRKVTELRVVASLVGDDRYDVVGRLPGGETKIWSGRGTGLLKSPSSIDLADDGTGAADRSDYDWVVEISDLRRHGRPDLVARDREGLLYRLDGTSKGFRSPRYLGEAVGYDLGG